MTGTDPIRGTVVRDLALLTLLAAALFLPALGGHDLWNPDEARYAQVSREMWQGGHVFVPRLNDEVYSEKPPLLFWSIIVASSPVGRVTETTARLPLALAAVAAILLVYRLGERLFGRRAAWFAAATFATCSKVLWQGRFGQIDMLLTALVTAAVWFWVRARTEGRPSLSLLFFLFAGLATLAKGPVGLLPPLLAILAFLGLEGDRQGLRDLRLGRGLLLWAAVVLAWLLPAALEGGRGYLETMVFKQNVTRYAEPWHHHQPWYYYLTVLPADFFPWSLLLPSAVVVGWKSLVGGGSGRRGLAALRPERDGGGGGSILPEERARQGFLFALCWVLVTLLFFSLSPGKRSVYVLTLYPALALLVGAGLDRLAAAWGRSRARDGRTDDAPGAPSRAWLVAPLASLATLLAAVTVALPFVAVRRPELEIVGTAFLATLVAALAALALAAVAASIFALRRHVIAAVASLAAGMGILILVAAFGLLPAFDAVKSARALAAELNARTPSAPYGIYPRLDSTVLFYAGRPATPLTSGEEVARFVRQPGPAWILAERDDWRRLREEGALESLPLLVEVARDRDPHQGYLLLTEAPAVAPPDEARRPSPMPDEGAVQEGTGVEPGRPEPRTLEPRTLQEETPATEAPVGE